MTWFNDVHSDKKDVSCSWEIAVKCGGQGADLVGAVGGHMKKGRRATGWCSAPHMPTVGKLMTLVSMAGRHGDHGWIKLVVSVDCTDHGLRYTGKHGRHRGFTPEFPVSSAAGCQVLWRPSGLTRDTMPPCPGFQA
jgi:hypothetical protein